MIHLGLMVVLFALLLSIYRRPYFAAANMITFIFIIVLISNAKYQVLREPLLFQDIGYFINTLRYPRLYLPFFGWGRALLTIIAIGGAVLGGLTLEKSLIGRFSTVNFIFTILALFIIGGMLVWLGVQQNLIVTIDPETDLRTLGLLGSFFSYWAEERKPFAVPRTTEFSTQPLFTCSAVNLPHVVVVESESFFDPRQWLPWINPEVLRNFDKLKQTAVCYGRVEVPVWGANTVRSEFAFLSGIDNNALGIHRFNPYRYMARQRVPTLARYLKNLGYRTVCVHPYHSKFYDRNIVFPMLGFDEFIDLPFFKETNKSGQYVSDLSLTDKVRQLLERYRKDSTRPVFMFIITMENHGPLWFERVEPSEAIRYYVSPPPIGCDDLTTYLRHLENADQMIGITHEYLGSLNRNSILCFFGDHLPILGRVYDLLGTPSRHTDYVVWSKKPSFGKPVYRDMRIENLSTLLVREIIPVRHAN